MKVKIIKRLSEVTRKKKKNLKSLRVIFREAPAKVYCLYIYIFMTYLDKWKVFSFYK